MSKKIKSAYELAMERMERANPDHATRELTPDQKAQIAEIRKVYQSKIAEQEIMISSKLAKLTANTRPEDLISKKEEMEMIYRREIELLKGEMERKIQEVRDL